jgi:hypothetical protein
MTGPAGGGLFYALDVQGPSVGDGGSATVVDFESAQMLPRNQTLLEPGQGIADMSVIYPLSDGTVSLFYQSTSGVFTQSQFGPTMLSPMMSRPWTSIPVVMHKDGTNVDVVVAVPDSTGNSIAAINVGPVPEKNLFTFDPTTLQPVDLTPLGGTAILSDHTCAMNWPGKLALFNALIGGGLQMGVADVATGKLVYTLTGSSALLASRTGIDYCAADEPRIQGTKMLFDLLWSENDNGVENLWTTQVQCTVP